MQNVLDDVDYQTNKDGYVQEAESLSQLEMHVQLLYQARVDTRYEVEKLNEKESMELFFWHAFNKPTPLEEFACVRGSTTLLWRASISSQGHWCILD